MGTFISHSPQETEKLGFAWGQEARPGWLIGLCGDLGAGKTQLVRGLAGGLGSPARVHSPTFALMEEYRAGRLPLVHLDLYRLDSPEAVARAGLEEYLNAPQGVVVVEWIERWLGPEAPVVRAGRLRLVRFEIVDEMVRKLVYEDFGA